MVSEEICHLFPFKRGTDQKENIDIFDFKLQPDKNTHIIPDVILADVSFISLTKILKYAKKNLSDDHTDFLIMLKPQFEAKPDQLNKGIIKNEKIRREIIKNFEQWLKQNGFVIIKKQDNTLHGKHGNLERFYWLKTQVWIFPS